MSFAAAPGHLQEDDEGDDLGSGSDSDYYISDGALDDDMHDADAIGESDAYDEALSFYEDRSDVAGRSLARLRQAGRHDGDYDTHAARTTRCVSVLASLRAPHAHQPLDLQVVLSDGAEYTARDIVRKIATAARQAACPRICAASCTLRRARETRAISEHECVGATLLALDGATLDVHEAGEAQQILRGVLCVRAL